MAGRPQTVGRERVAAITQLGLGRHGPLHDLGSESVAAEAGVLIRLRPSQAVGDVSPAALGASLTGYILTYIALFLAYMVVITHLSGKGAEAY